MGLRMLSVTIGALVFLGTVDFFSHWYARFLNHRPISDQLRILLRRTFWAVFAVTFWVALLNYGLPEQFDTTHLLFVLFIYSVRGLIISFFFKNVPDT